jgi:NAD-dependent SIR2 family protein deacetylase
MNNNKVMSIARELAKGNFIVFSGAGIPRTAGVPDWPSLLRGLLALAPSVTVNIDNADPKEFPDIAQEIFDSLRQQSKEDEYYKTIKDSIKPTDAPYSAQQFEIVTTTNWIVTTNFDTTFESAFKKKQEVLNSSNTPNIESLPDFSMENLFTKESIVYIHGRADEKFIIFKTDDYEKYYPSASPTEDGAKDVEDYLKYIFKNYTIVFVGFSFDDRYIKKSLKNIYMELKRSDEIGSAKPSYSSRLDKIRHYAFLKSVDSGNNDHLIESYENFSSESEEYKNAIKLMKSKKLDEELESINIKVVRYGEHIDWIYCFEKIREFKQRDREAAYENEK